MLSISWMFRWQWVRLDHVIVFSFRLFFFFVIVSQQLGLKLLFCKMIYVHQENGIAQLWVTGLPVKTLRFPCNCQVSFWISEAAFSHCLVFMHAKSLQLCPTLCDPIDGSPPGSSVHRILQARILEWVAMPSSRGSSRLRDQTCISFVSCICRQFLFYQHHLGNPSHYLIWT